MTRTDFTTGIKIGLKLAITGYALAFALLLACTGPGLLFVPPMLPRLLDTIWGND
jgi:hypothetical protein